MRTSARVRGHALAAAAILTLGTGCVVHAQHPPVPPPAVTVGFYDVLNPWGQWVVVTGFGTVWRPHAHVVGADFYPYFTGGHWVYSEYGWTWTSNWEWGWVPFHHGRWFFSTEYGWVWIPGDVWGPAWVEWRFGGGYVGWVPLGPPGFHAAYAPRWCWLQARHLHRHDFHRARLVGPDEELAFHAAAPVVRAEGEAPRGPPPAGVASFGAPVEPVRLGPPRSLRRGDVESERRLAPPPGAAVPRPADERPGRGQPVPPTPEARPRETLPPDVRPREPLPPDVRSREPLPRDVRPREPLPPAPEPRRPEFRDERPVPAPPHLAPAPQPAPFPRPRPEPPRAVPAPAPAYPAPGVVPAPAQPFPGARPGYQPAPSLLPPPPGMTPGSDDSQDPRKKKKKKGEPEPAPVPGKAVPRKR